MTTRRWSYDYGKSGVGPTVSAFSEKLGIVFNPDEYDAWRYLANRMLYTPVEGTSKKSGVHAIGLTGDFSADHALGDYWKGAGGAVLVMDRREVIRRNDITPVQYGQVDTVVADNLRVLRRVSEGHEPTQVFAYPMMVILALAHPDLKHALLTSAKNKPENSKVRVLMRLHGKSQVEPLRTSWDFPAQFTRAILKKNRFNTLRQMQAAIDRDGYKLIEEQLAKEPVPEKGRVLFWKTTYSADGKTLTSIDADFTKIAGGQSITMAQFLAALKRAQDVRDPEVRALRELAISHISDDILREMGGFSGELEWIINPTADPLRPERTRERSYSAVLNIPPGSVLYLIDGNLDLMSFQVLPVSFAGLWIASVPDSVEKFEDYEKLVSQSIRAYQSGSMSLESVYATAKKARIQLLGPNIYWTTRQIR